MTLEPLQQWCCDTCGTVIERPEDGWLEWLDDVESGGRNERDFRIVHWGSASPRTGGCQQHATNINVSDNHLQYFVGDGGFGRLMVALDVRAFIDRQDIDPGVKSARLQEVIEIERRLHLPYYEEARRYWSKAEADGFFDGTNGSPLMQDNLKALIARYGAA